MAARGHHNQGGGKAYDGWLRCMLCSDSGDSGQAWCPAAKRLVCDDCCREIMSGEPHRLMTALLDGDGDLGIRELLEACSDCGRLQARLAEDEVDAIGHAEPPLTH